MFDMCFAPEESQFLAEWIADKSEIKEFIRVLVAQAELQDFQVEVLHDRTFENEKSQYRTTTMVTRNTRAATQSEHRGKMEDAHEPLIQFRAVHVPSSRYLRFSLLKSELFTQRPRISHWPRELPEMRDLQATSIDCSQKGRHTSVQDLL